MPDVVDCQSLGAHAKPVVRLLQHAILQLCNEHVAYNNKLQILGVLCLTIDDEQHDIVVKVNNTLKRVNPPIVVAPRFPSNPNTASLGTGLIANGVFPVPSHGTNVNTLPSHNSLSSLRIHNVTSLSSIVHPLFLRENTSNVSLQKQNDRAESPDVIVVDKDTNEVVREAAAIAKKSGGRKKTTPSKARNIDDETNPLYEEDMTTILPADPKEMQLVGARQLDAYASQLPAHGKSAAFGTVRSHDAGKVSNNNRQSKALQREAASHLLPCMTVSQATSLSSLNNMTTIRALLSGDTSAGPQTGIPISTALANNAQNGFSRDIVLPQFECTSSMLPSLLNGPQFAVQPVFTVDLNSALEKGSLSPSKIPGHEVQCVNDSTVSVMVDEIKEEPMVDDSTSDECSHMMMSGDSDKFTETTLNDDGNNDDVAEIVGFTPERRRRNHSDILGSIVSSWKPIANGLLNDEDGFVDSSPSTSGSSPQKKKVKDLLSLNDKTPTKLLVRFNTDTSDFMMDQLGVSETKRRRRRGQYLECLTMEEVAEYMGPSDAGDVAFKCTHCTEPTATLTQYLHHTFTTHGAYICHECGKQFTTKSSLLRHRPIHTGMRRFVCSFCKKTFYRKDKCKAHIKRHLGLHDNSLELEDSTKLDETAEQAVM